MKRYSDEQILKNTYFYFTKNEKTNQINTFLCRPLKKIADEAYLMIRSRIEYDDLLQEQKNYYSVYVEDASIFEERYMKANNFLNDFEVYVFEKNGQKTEVLFDKYTQFAFEKQDDNYNLIDLYEKLDNFLNSPDYVSNNQNIHTAKNILLDYIQQTDLFENEKVHQIFLDTYTNVTNLLSNPQHDPNPKHFENKDIEHAYELLKNTPAEQSQGLVENLYQKMAKEPTVIKKVIHVANEMYDINIQIDATNPDEVFGLDLESKRMLLECFFVILSNYNNRDTFISSTNIESNKQQYEKEAENLYTVLKLLEKEMQNQKADSQFLS